MEEMTQAVAAQQAALDARFGTFGQELRSRAVAELRRFLDECKGVALTTQELEDVQWAAGELALCGLESAVSDPADAPRLNQRREDALSVLRGIEAIKTFEAERRVVAIVSRLFALAQDAILRGLQLAAAAP